MVAPASLPRMAAMAAAARIESFLCEGPYLEYVDGLAARFLATLGKKRTDDDAQMAREELWRFEHGNAVLRWGLAEFLGKKPLDPGTEAEARKLIVDHFAFKKFLDDARKTFAPQAGAGGHQDETWLQRALAEATIEVCDKRRRSRERDED